MSLHKIAGVYVDLSYKGATLKHQAPAYETNDDVQPDFTIALPDGYIYQKKCENPHLSMNECEYIWTGSEFYNQILNYDGFLLHSSAVVYKNEAYLFSAPSGTGKSTHTGLWLEVFGDEAKILNDDKPAIRIEDGKVYAYGTPWSGKTDMNINMRVPLKAICFIERSPENHIGRVTTAEAIGLIMNQTIRPGAIERMDKLLVCLDKILPLVPVYKMGCNISHEAALMAYNAMSGDNSE